MDPSDPALASLTQAEFESIFRPNVRWLRVVTKDEKEWYAPIVAVDFPNRRLTLGSSPPPSGYCLAGFGQGWVNPVGWLRYELRAGYATASLLAEVLNSGIPERRTSCALEVRSDGTAVEGTALTLAENVVDLQFYDFGFDSALQGWATTITHYPVIENVAPIGGGGLLGTDPVIAEPNNLRYFTIKMSVRTPTESQDFEFEPRNGPYSPLRLFEVDPEMVGAARVEGLASRVDLRNFTLRRLK